MTDCTDDGSDDDIAEDLTAWTEALQRPPEPSELEGQREALAAYRAFARQPIVPC